MLKLSPKPSVNLLVAVLFLFGFSSFSYQFATPFNAPKILLITSGWLVLLLQKKVTSRGLPMWILVTLLFPWLSLIWCRDALSGLMFLLAVSLAILPILFQVPSWEKTFGKIILIVACLIAVVGFLQIEGLIFSSLESPNSPSSLFGNPWVSAQFVLMALWFLPEEFKGRRALVLFLALFIVTTGSKTAISGLIFYFVNLCRPLRSFKMKGMVLSLVLGTLGSIWIYFQPPDTIKSILDPGTYLKGYDQQSYIIAKRDPLYQGKTHSLVSRVILWENSTCMVAKEPLRGFGIDQFRVYYPRFSQAVHPDPNLNGMYRPVSAHCFVLTSAISLGIPWTLAFLGFILWFGTQLKRSNHRMAWFYFWVTALWQPVWICLPLLFVFTGAPSRDGKQVSTAFRWILATLIFLLALSEGSLAFQAGQAQTASNSDEVSDLFSFRKAELMFTEGKVSAAHDLFKKNLENDPYSPEALFNSLQTANLSEAVYKLEHEKLKAAFPYFRLFCVSDEMRCQSTQHPINHKTAKDLASFLE